MSEKGLTNISLKKINKSKVYQYIYRKKKTSKQQIVQELQMGLSTVSQNLNLLEQEGLIEKKRLFASTGGRKANAIQIVSDFKIQVCITKISTFLILCDLAVCLATLYVSFSLVFALMRYLQGKVFLIRFYSPTTLSSSRAEFRLPSRLACA